MARTLDARLDALPADVQVLLERHRFDRARFLALAERLAKGGARDNRVAGRVVAPAAGDVAELPPDGSSEHTRLVAIGREELASGRVALAVLAGGMATRMGGVVKALVEAIPGHTFLDLRLAEMDALERRVGRRPPLWLMTSSATDAAVRDALGSRIDGERIGVFVQSLSLRLTPEADLFLDAEQRPSEHAPGHGDLPDALRASGLLERFLERGGRTLMVANLDNLGATLDDALIGWHLEHSGAVSCEVVDKIGADRGGIPVRLDGRPVVLEEFRLPADFDAASVRVFNTNTFHFDARALFELDAPWSFFAVEKKVDGTPVVQFERLIGEVTSWLDTRFVRVPRLGERSRFLPVKDMQELAERRVEIEAVVRARGISP
jgi:UTP--glucose-1-phosphate uridylyltransferase